MPILHKQRDFVIAKHRSAEHAPSIDVSSVCAVMTELRAPIYDREPDADKPRPIEAWIALSQMGEMTMNAKFSAHGGIQGRFARLGVGSALAAASAMLLSVAAFAQANRTPDISGIWQSVKYSPKIELQGGGDIPYNDKGKALYAKNIAGLKDGSIKDEARHLCVPDGIPRILGNPYPFKVIQTPGQTTLAYELNRVFRVVVMDKPQASAHELEIAPYYSGHSIGHWEGDTLVIETAGFNEKTYLDATGAPHSDQMTTIERVRKVGRQLEDVVTVTDPDLLTRPITARFVYDLHPEVRLEDYVCGEPHRDISKVPGVTEARRARGQ